MNMGTLLRHVTMHRWTSDGQNLITNFSLNLHHKQPRPQEISSKGPSPFAANNFILDGLFNPSSSQIWKQKKQMLMNPRLTKTQHYSAAKTVELTSEKTSTEASGAALKKCRTLLGCWMRFLAACSGEEKRLFRLPWKSLKLLVLSSSSYDWPGMMACCLDTLQEWRESDADPNPPHL